MDKNDISLASLVKKHNHSIPPAASNPEELYVAAASHIPTFVNKHKITQEKDYMPYIFAALAVTMVVSLIAILS